MMAYPKTPLAGMTADEVSWMSGRWASAADGEQIEEVWSPPEGGIMMGVFRWLKGGEPAFYEFMLLKPGSSGLELHIKHFNPDLTGWEEKDQSTAFDLVHLGEREAAFFPQKEGSSGWAVYRIDSEGGLVFEEVAEQESSDAKLCLRFAPVPLEQGGRDSTEETEGRR